MKLTIDIDCNEKTCGKCKLIWYDDEGFPNCAPFEKAIYGEKLPNGYYKAENPFRLPECIAACKGQKA